MNKSKLRRHFKMLRQTLGAAQRQRLSRAIAAHCLAMPELQVCQHVGLYAARDTEVETLDLAQTLQQRHVCCYYPRVNGAQLDFAPGWQSPASNALPPAAAAMPVHRAALALQPGYFDVCEPQTAAVALTQVTLLIIPGLAFDRQGQRLGYGKGFYDRTLQSYRGVRVGLVFQACFTDCLPTHAGDQPVHWVVTDAGVWRCRC